MERLHGVALYMASSKAPGLKRDQIDKAVSALLKYVGSQKSDSKDLLEDEEYLYLVSPCVKLNAVSLRIQAVTRPLSAEHCAQEDSTTA